MRKALTDKALEALKPQARRYKVHDLYCPGLTVRVSPEGRKSFTVKYRYGIKQKRLTVGVYPRMPLSKARERAIGHLRQVDQGVDPSERRRQPGYRVEAIVADFIRQYAKPRNRHWKETERILQREFVAVFGQRDIREIKRGDVLEILDAALERGVNYQANRIHSNIRKLFNWCVERGIVDLSPINGLKAPFKETSRDRVLDDQEIRTMLHTCRNDVYPRDSLVLVDELATNKNERPSEGLGWTVPILGEAIVEICKRWDVPARGVADDAIFAKTGHGSGSIADEFARCGVQFRPARKADRLTGWNIMRRLLADAGKPDVPGLYISRGCEYFWTTVPYLARDQKRVEDVDSSGPDHAADAVRYGCLRREDRMQRVSLKGI